MPGFARHWQAAGSQFATQLVATQAQAGRRPNSL